MIMIMICQYLSQSAHMIKAECISPEDTPEMRIRECRLCPDPGSGTKLIFMNEAESVMSA